MPTKAASSSWNVAIGGLQILVQPERLPAGVADRVAVAPDLEGLSRLGREPAGGLDRLDVDRGLLAQAELDRLRDAGHARVARARMNLVDDPLELLELRAEDDLLLGREPGRQRPAVDLAQVLEAEEPLDDLLDPDVHAKLPSVVGDERTYPFCGSVEKRVTSRSARSSGRGGPRYGRSGRARGSRTAGAARRARRFLGVADHLERDRLRPDVDDVGAEDGRDLHHAGPGLARLGRDLDQGELALDPFAPGQVRDLDHVDQLVELLDHLLDLAVVAADDERDPARPLLLGRTDREGLDVEAPAAEEARDPREDAGLVLDQDRERVPLHSWPPIISLIAAPAGTMGKTFSSRSTRTSTTNGPSWSRAASRAARTSAGSVTRTPSIP